MIDLEIYTVQAGDTALSIAERFGVSLQRLISDNSLSASGQLAVGQALLILRPETVHTFSRGDTLFSIAETYETSVMQLYRNNPFLIGADYIPEGTQIAITFETSPTEDIQVSGFAYGYINRHVLEAALPYLTYVIVFGYGFNEDGSLIEVNDNDIIEMSHEYSVSVFLSLTSINVDGTFGSGKIERLLTDIDFQNLVIENLIEVIRRKNAQGLDIDMEYISPQLRTEFAVFVGNATRQLNAVGLETHVDLAPKTSANQVGTLYEAHDYGLLGNAANLVFLMTYEWGYTYGPPMAVA
ncbi:MAG: LysM peptidoglycan-binding domain-containing protein, partial [Oscillospiraceae bacterium]|nr:LysM peptidoglycan-binding domain-containing protein [Oscillospiraceae bacterium]